MTACLCACLRATRRQTVLLLACFSLAVVAAYAVEFQVLDKFSVDGYTELRGSAAVSGGNFAVGGSTFVVKGGNVGIGTTEPGAKLEVRGSAFINDASYSLAGIRLNTAYNGSNLTFSGTPDGSGYYHANLIGGRDALAYSYGSYLAFTTEGKNTANSADTSAERMRIDSLGNVGIGTTLPSGTLHVDNTAGTPTIYLGASNASDKQIIFNTLINNVAKTNSIQSANGSLILNKANSAAASADSALGLFANAGSLNSGNPFWQGWQFGGGDTITESGANRFPRASHYWSYSKLADPTDLTYNIAVGNTGVLPAAVNIQSSGSGNIVLQGGNVGIGTTAPGASLNVVSLNTVAMAFKVQTGSVSGTEVVISTAGKVGVGTTNPMVTLDLAGTDAVKIPVGTTEQRPANPANGMLRVNTTTGKLEYYNGGWNSIGAVSATGGTVTEAGGYRVHTFIGSGTLTISGAGGNIEALVVAGGGSGGGAGGGGGGGVIYNTSYAVTSGQTIPVTVGAGGATKNGNGVGNSGNNSIFGSLTAIGGGGGGAHSSGAGSNGGSGGGGGSCNAGTITPGSGTFGQGNSGGTGSVTCNPYTSGGGGGAGAAGDSVSVNQSGNGGAGRQVNIDGNNYYYGGGGGGGAQANGQIAGNGGLGGGGGGAQLYSGTAGAGGGSARDSGGNGQQVNVYPPCDGGAGGVNTGGGGGGMGVSVSNGGAGGSGIVIVRYPL